MEDKTCRDCKYYTGEKKIDQIDKLEKFKCVIKDEYTLNGVEEYWFTTYITCTQFKENKFISLMKEAILRRNIDTESTS